jgi:UDP-N-acetyl-D-mannosaminuronic acid dehydrogenase
VADAPPASEAYFVCVGTPLAGARADLADLGAAIEAISTVAPPGALVVIESTVPVGTTGSLAAAYPSLSFAVAPERVLPGDALREIATNDRVVGGDPRAAELLATYCRGRIDRVDPRLAELSKLVENAARDVQLALANTVAATSERLGVDPVALRRVVNRHPRVELLEPGIGVGGHCLPVDPWFLVGAAPEETRLLRAAREANDAVPERMIARIASHPGTIGLLGLAYKPDVDDARGSPAARIALALSAQREVIAADPYVEVVGVRAGSLEEVLARDVVVLLVAHRDYVALRARVLGTALDLCGGWR